MKAVLLIDFGSTYTKVTAVDVEGERLLGTAQAYTTVQTDINEGLKNALQLLEEKIGKVDFAETGKLLHVILPYAEKGDKDALKLKELLAEVREDGKIDPTESEIVIGLLDVLSERYNELTAGLGR